VYAKTLVYSETTRVCWMRFRENVRSVIDGPIAQWLELVV